MGQPLVGRVLDCCVKVQGSILSRGICLTFTCYSPLGLMYVMVVLVYLSMRLFSFQLGESVFVQREYKVCSNKVSCSHCPQEKKVNHLNFFCKTAGVRIIVCICKIGVKCNGVWLLASFGYRHVNIWQSTLLQFYIEVFGNVKVYFKICLNWPKSTKIVL